MAEQAKTRKHFVLSLQTTPLTGEPDAPTTPRSARPLATYELALNASAIADLAEEDPVNTLMDLYIARTRWMN